MTENYKRLGFTLGRQTGQKEIYFQPLPVRVIDIDDPYTGPYEADPKFTAQTLLTAGKTLSRNVRVLPIYMTSTTNPSGGQTVYIGGEYRYG